MVWNCNFPLDDNMTLKIGATDGDVRFTIEDDCPAPGSPSSYNWSLSPMEAMGLAETLLKTVRDAHSNLGDKFDPLK